MSEAKFTKDMEHATLVVERVFDAPVASVWDAHTKSEWLEQWWAPKPWKAVTVEMDFREGGRWFYYMLGPDGERHYCIQTYDGIVVGQSTVGDDYFCDEEGVKKTDMPVSRWKTELVAEGTGTKLVSTVTYATRAELETVLAMGMEAGYAMGLSQLEALLKQA
ncbi:MAG: SRPBCC domain-containing protein [Candidatus Moraniibacteriota bacterium]